ncbi:hypothetical protein DFH11DRAFT_1811269 [Phellopilus nigrolimitatus]|nr:hypothetical protein DFH11DRAFT_1811269 [Phellopilus nigrolimitatus]
MSDNILLIINNLAPSNFEAKLAEMKEHFEELYSRWLANYLVDQRGSTEPNNHQLYLRFLDGLDNKLLGKFILHETFIKCATLLNSDRVKTSTSKRTILKNLGSWLGQITLARDKPIKHKNLASKDFLIESTDSDTHHRDPIPAKSKAFRPPNPWLMAVVSLLAGLYHFAELKLNMKFEIEVLCKTLRIDLGNVEVANILRSRPPVESMAGPGLPDLMPDIDALPIGSGRKDFATDPNEEKMRKAGHMACQTRTNAAPYHAAHVARAHRHGRVAAAQRCSCCSRTPTRRSWYSMSRRGASPR